MTIDWSKPVHLASDHEAGPVRILCRDAPAPAPVIGLLPAGNIMRWTADGQYEFGTNRGIDLINAPEPAVTATGWANVHEGDWGRFVLFGGSTKAEADESAAFLPLSLGSRIACVPVTITYRRGDGLEGGL